MKFVRIMLAMLVGNVCVFANAAADQPAIPGHAIIARAAGSALVIWDATPEVASIVKDKIGDADANVRLERDALGEIDAEAPHLRNATTIAVRVIYTKSGDVSPVYGSPTFEGVERYAVLTMSSADVKSDRDQWREAVAGTAKMPSWIAFDVVGALPPR